MSRSREWGAFWVRVLLWAAATAVVYAIVIGIAKADAAPSSGAGWQVALVWLLVVGLLLGVLWAAWEGHRTAERERRWIRPDHRVGGVWQSWGRDQWADNRAVRDTRAQR